MSGTIDTARPQRNARCLIGGKWGGDGPSLDVIDPFSGQAVTHVTGASEKDVGRALAAAVAARDAAAMPGYRRAELLRKAQAIIRDRSEAIAISITRETGKPIRDTRAELKRSLETLGLCAEEAIRIEGRHLPLDGSEIGAGKLAVMLRFPVGVVGAIVPFNAPFNLACHKVGPAIAAGNAIVLKTPPEAPTCLDMLAQAFIDAGIAPGALNVLHGGADVGEAIVRDPRVDFITFTGSTRAGLAVKNAAGLRRVTLELGGLGPNIVHADADVAKVAPLCAMNGTRLAGQSCISVQNLFVHRSVFDRFVPALVETVRGLRMGDPMDPATDVGPLINRAAAERVASWVGEAQAAGARVLVGGHHRDAFFEPTVVADVAPQMKVVCQEIFGPVIAVRPYEDIAEPIAWINASGFGLNCGLFTDSTRIAMRAAREIRCGAVIVNATSTFRPDQMPYGGVGMSGLGREGPARAIQDMTEERLLVINE